MKLHLFLFGVVAANLCGCASHGYVPAAGQLEYGYSEQKLSEDTYLVAYNGGGMLTEDKLVQYAVRRAVEIAQSERADWFIVLRDNANQPPTFLVQGARGAPRTLEARFGHQFATSRRRSQCWQAQGEFANCSRVREYRPVQFQITIQVGNGVAPESGDVYLVGPATVDLTTN